MEHKAFLLNYQLFENELIHIIEKALVVDDYKELKSFVNENIKDLKDPYEGEPLELDWESLIEEKDPHQYCDFALTKYYNPLEDIGLGYEWDESNDYIMNNLKIDYSPVLGNTLGPKNNYFDPGKIGAYFQSVDIVKHNLLVVRDLRDSLSNDKLLDPAIAMLSKAIEHNAGLYITF